MSTQTAPIPRAALINRNQRGLVDTCFEEGQYEAGIALLDQLRSPSCRPYPGHIRQLLCIALYPPPPAEMTQAENLQMRTASPSKLQARLNSIQQGSSMAPSPTASASALFLLNAFAVTNKPSDLFEELPCYPESNTATSSAAASNVTASLEDDYSFIAKRSARIKTAKNVWEILKEGFIQRKDQFIPMSPTKRARNRRSIYSEEHGDLLSADGETPAPVGQYAWPVLEWILRILERDEKLAEATGLPRHSPLLISQIPPPRSKNGGRWDVEIPLDITVHCLEQADHRQAAMGARLLALLMNLAATTVIDFPMFLNAVASRVSQMPCDAVDALFGMLPQTKAMMQFKLALCNHYLAQSSDAPMRSKPQPRAPRPVPARRRQESAMSESPNPQISSPTVPDTPTLRKYPAMAAQDVLQLVAAQARSGILSRRLKWELVVTYGLLQQLAAVDDKDQEWQDALRSGRVRDALRVGSESRKLGSSAPIPSPESMERMLAVLCVG